jgi:hypothetical protein
MTQSGPPSSGGPDKEENIISGENVAYPAAPPAATNNSIDRNSALEFGTRIRLLDECTKPMVTFAVISDIGGILANAGLNFDDLARAAVFGLGQEVQP